MSPHLVTSAVTSARTQGQWKSNWRHWNSAATAGAKPASGPRDPPGIATTQSCTRVGGEAAEASAGLYQRDYTQLIGATREKSISQLQAQPLLFSAHVSVWMVFSCNFLAAAAGISFSTHFAASFTFVSQRAKSCFDRAKNCPAQCNWLKKLAWNFWKQQVGSACS